MNLFGRKSKKPVTANPNATSDTIKRLREQVETLEKRELHLEKKIQAQLLEAKKKSASKDKRGAIFCLKRKKMYEKEIEKIQGTKMTLETQVITLENAHVNMETYSALRSGANQLKSIHGQVSVDTVDDMMDDIQEEMATADEIGQAISQPIGTEIYDDDELEDELRELDELTLEGEEEKAPAAKEATAAPAKTPATATPAPSTASAAKSSALPEMPEVPTHKPESKVKVDGDVNEDELEDLRRLEAEMGM